MPKKIKPAIINIQSDKEKLPEIGSKALTKVLGEIQLQNRWSSFQVATYPNGTVKVFIKFPTGTNIGGAYHVTVDPERDHICINVVGPSIAKLITVEQGTGHLDICAYEWIHVYQLQDRTARRLRKAFDNALSIRVQLAHIETAKRTIRDIIAEHKRKVM